jgi:hypothetical protein
MALLEVVMQYFLKTCPNVALDFCHDQKICPVCFRTQHKTPDFHERHRKRRDALNVMMVIVFLVAIMAGETWRTQWKKTVWRFLPHGTSVSA